LKNHKADTNTKKERGNKKRKRKRRVIGVKPKIFSIHMPAFHGGNVKKNRTSPQ
jgi:hypothetical protein